MPTGFGLLVRPPTAPWKLNASWIFQVNGPPPRSISHRVAIGRFGQMSLEQTLEQAKELRKAIRAGENPNTVRKQAVQGAAERNAFTVGDVMDLYLKHLARHASERSHDNFQEDTARYLADWFKRPIASLTKAELRDRHESPTTTDR